MIIIPYHEEKQETHSECNYFGTDVASCVHIHPTATPNNLHFHPQSLSHRSTESLLSIKQPNIH